MAQLPEFRFVSSYECKHCKKSYPERNFYADDYDFCSTACLNAELRKQETPSYGKTYVCATCGKVYEGRQFHCYDFDFCRKQCMNAKIDPIRKREEEEAEALRARQKTIGRIDARGARAY
jgi:hypothetical protein